MLFDIWLFVPAKCVARCLLYSSGILYDAFDREGFQHMTLFEAFVRFSTIKTIPLSFWEIVREGACWGCVERSRSFRRGKCRNATGEFCENSEPGKFSLFSSYLSNSRLPSAVYNPQIGFVFYVVVHWRKLHY